MTLVELMVAIAVTAVVMTLSLSIFYGQFRSYKSGQETKEIQETSNGTLDFVKRELAQAGWSVRPEMSFFIQDGGSAGTDQIYINDTSLVDLNSSFGRSLMTQANGCGGCAEIAGGSGTATVTVSSLYIDNDTITDFKANATHYVISDQTGAGNRIAKIQTITGNQLNLDRTTAGRFLAPAVFYYVETGQILRRSDRSSSGAQPFAENVADLQVAYRDRSGNWYGVSGCAGAGVGAGFCSMSPFNPAMIGLVRVTLTSRSTNPIGIMNNLKYCRPAVENRAAAALGSTECGYVYRTYSVSIQPRNTSNEFQ